MEPHQPAGATVSSPNVKENCRHCGLPLTGQSRRTTGAKRDRFCCYGCYLIHEATGAEGVEGKPILFLARLGLAGFLAMNVMTLTWVLYGDTLPILFPVEPAARRALVYAIFLLSVPVFLLIGILYIKNAWREIACLSPGVDSLIAIGTLAAFVYSTYETFSGGGSVYFDTATMVLVLVTFGRYLDANARAKTSNLLRNLFSREPLMARVMSGEGDSMVPAETVRPCTLLRVLPGETIPVDALVQDGTTSVNESMLTGEAMPRLRSVGDVVIGGSINVDGHVIIRSMRTAQESVLSRLQKLTEQIHASRSPLQLLTDRISGVFVPGVIVIAVVSGIWSGFAEGVPVGLLRGLTVLLIACPCALGIGASLAVSVGYAAAARRAVVLTSAAVLESVGRIQTMFFDKTGTLTEGHLTVEKFDVLEQFADRKNDVLQWAAALEAFSEHPIGQAILDYARTVGLAPVSVVSSKVMPGRGIEGEIRTEDGSIQHIRIGQNSSRSEINQNNTNSDLTSASLLISHEYCGAFLLRDHTRESAPEAFRALNELGVSTRILSGDRQSAVDACASVLGPVGEAMGALTPEEKVQLVSGETARGRFTCMIGDGINDAPALAAANVGIALRSGTDLSRVVADVTILDDDLRRIPWLVAFSRRVVRTIRWNLWWAFFYNVAGIVLAVLGILQPIWAAAAMVISSLIVVGNSARLANGETYNASMRAKRRVLNSNLTRRPTSVTSA